MNDIRDTKRIRTLPDDLREIANKMLEDKFQLASQGDIVEKKPAKEDTETHPFIDPNILNSIERYYYDARRNGGSPDTLYVSHPVRAALLRDKGVRQYASYSRDGLPMIMGMELKSDSQLPDDKFVFIDGRNGRMVLDSELQRYHRNIPSYVPGIKW